MRQSELSLVEVNLINADLTSRNNRLYKVWLRHCILPAKLEDFATNLAIVSCTTSPPFVVRGHFDSVEIISTSATFIGRARSLAFLSDDYYFGWPGSEGTQCSALFVKNSTLHISNSHIVSLTAYSSSVSADSDAHIDRLCLERNCYFTLDSAMLFRIRRLDVSEFSKLVVVLAAQHDAKQVLTALRGILNLKTSVAGCLLEVRDDDHPTTRSLFFINSKGIRPAPNEPLLVLDADSYAHA